MPCHRPHYESMIRRGKGYDQIRKAYYLYHMADRQKSNLCHDEMLPVFYMAFCWLGSFHCCYSLLILHGQSSRLWAWGRPYQTESLAQCRSQHFLQVHVCHGAYTGAAERRPQNPDLQPVPSHAQHHGY